tara:strand:+ start:176 stop:583 length:408 start_codon:yes stop_codon:yes gene_type:complete
MSNTNVNYDKEGEDNINKKKELICNYHVALINGGNLQSSKDNITTFKNKLLTNIGTNKSNIDKLSNITLNQSKTLEDLEEMEERLQETSGKLHAGTELKQNIYEENTALTMHLIYYVLGIGFMGYYAIRLMKGKQ